LLVDGDRFPVFLGLALARLKDEEFIAFCALFDDRPRPYPSDLQCILQFADLCIVQALEEGYLPEEGRTLL